MKRKLATIVAAVLISAFSLMGAASCGALQDEVESPVREATQQVQQTGDVQQQVEEVQRQQLEDVQ